MGPRSQRTANGEARPGADVIDFRLCSIVIADFRSRVETSRACQAHSTMKERMLRRSFVFALPALFSAIACASPSDATSTSAAEVHSGGICSTLDYGPRAAPKDYYRYFASDAEASAYVQKLLEGPLAGSGTLKEVTRDERLNRLVGEVYAGFKKAFPHETEGTPADAPRVAILQTDVINAFALGPTTIDSAVAPRSPWLFFVNTGLLDQHASDDELRGVFAHELGHLLVRTFLPEVKARVRATYVIRGTEDGVLGEAQENDPAAAAHVEDILKHQDRVGGWPKLGIFALDRTGYPSAGYTRFYKILQTAGASGPSAPAACAGISTDLKALETAQIANVPDFDAMDLSPRDPNAEERAKLDGLTTTLKNDLRACLASMNGGPASLADVVAFLNGLPPSATDPADARHAELVALMLPVELQVDRDFAGAPLLDRMFEADARLRAELAALKDDPRFPIANLRIYDSEEDADDASMRVLASIGQDPLGIGSFFTNHFMPEAARERCLADIAAGRLVSYGSLVDVHPATCWRYYHGTQFAKAVSACTFPVTRAPKSPAAPSIADQRTIRGFNGR